MSGRVEVVAMGRMGYAAAYARQVAAVEEVLAGREAGRGPVARLLMVEHDPVVTVSNRPTARGNVLASPEALCAAGVEVAETDRGGDVTYHGPGQAVVYPIVDLNGFGFRLHDYARFLEEVVIGALARWGVRGERDAGATGVWVEAGEGLAKVAAIGVRVRRWVSMHGLALNVRPRMEHFGLIVPCGLVGRRVTSLAEVLGEGAPTLEEAHSVLGEEFVAGLEGRLAGREGRVGDEPRGLGTA